MVEQDQPIPVQFPLTGEWCAVNTPGHQIPSHGTDQLGQRYAYDFGQIDWQHEGFKFYKTSVFRSILFGVQLKDTYGWAKPIYAPFDGEVVEVMDGLKERNPAHILIDMAIALKNGLFFKAKNNEELRPILGNYIILKKAEGVYCLIAHAQKDSIKVSKGELVNEKQIIANVGHSGNSTAPHLHFQLMNSLNLLEAEGLPCCFKEYQVFKDGHWETVLNGIPGRRVRFRTKQRDSTDF